MPAEAYRFHHRIGRRDRWFLGVLAAAAVASLLVAGALALQREPSPRSAACVETTRAWIMGAITIKRCGADAAAFCHRYADDEKIAAQCERIGVKI
jgi:hypothetical protein